MRVLGIDPGLQTTGFGVVDVDGHQLVENSETNYRQPSIDVAHTRGSIDNAIQKIFSEVAVGKVCI